jgi:hypothetical protein
MIKKLSVVLLLSFACLDAQDRIAFSVNPGWSMYNSENTMDVTKEKKFRWLPAWSLTYERENVLGHTLHLEYNLTYRKLDGVLRFVLTSEAGPEPIGYRDADLELAMNNLDIDMHTELGMNFSVDYGPTLSCISRTFSVDADGQNRGSVFSQELDDRLVSYGLGLNGSLSYELPLSVEKEHYYFYSGLKLYFIHALWFDARGRNVDEYYQSFCYAQLRIGLGYSF